jgi:hypothetical protein
LWSVATTLVIGLAFVWQTGSADAGIVPTADCPFADVETATECQITAAWTVGPGGSPGNNFPAPGLPGPYTFHKTLRITGTGSLDTRPTGAATNETTPGISIIIDGAGEGVGGLGGAFLMDAGASLINANDPGPNDPPNNPAGPISVTATGGATLQAGSIIQAENNIQGGNAGAITLSFGGHSLFAGTISSSANAGTTGNDGGDITIGITGDLTMAPGSVITSQKNANGGNGGHIAITVSGDMTLQGGAPGALITSEHPAASSGAPGGNITIAVGTGDLGTFTMEQGSHVDSSSRGRAGNIKITAGDEINVDAGASVLAGQRATQDTQGHGGRIFVIAGCQTNIFGTLSSQGRDPGADLVHVEGCEVHLGPDALVESTASGHQPTVPNSCDGIDDPATEPGGDAGEVLRGDHPANSTVCVEIWGRHVTIDEGAEVNANFALDGGAEGHGWIDIFAEQDIVIDGPAAAPFAVHTNSSLGTDIAGDIRVMAKHSFVTASGLALQASAIGNGSDGGTIAVNASGLVNLDGATLEAAGDNVGDGNGGLPDQDPCDPSAFSGACGNGGVITVQSHNNSITWQGGVGNVNPDVGPAPPAGSVSLTACTTVTTTGTNFDDATPTVNQGAACGSVVPIPECVAPPACDATHYVIFNPGGRWDRCGESTISGQKFNDKGVGLPGWMIHITGPGVDITTVTGANGQYSFTVPGGQTYTVCEVLLDNTWTQVSPVGPGAGLAPCSGPGEAPWGYSVDLNQGGECCGGQNVTGKDFVNKQASLTECPEDKPRGPLMTRTVNPNLPLGGGAVAGDPANYHTLQAAYDAAKMSPSTKNEVIGMFSKTKENVVLGYYSAKTMTITQCTSAQITANDSSQPVWRLTSTKKLLIIGPDSVGGTIGWSIEAGTHELKSIRSNGASVAGVRINTNSNKISFNNVATSGAGAIGIDILGNSNKLTSGTIGPNSGAGIHIGPGKTGNSVSGATIKDNTGNGVFVEGNSNTIKSNKLYTNAPAGIRVTGNTNTIQSNQSDQNTGDGYNIAGTGNIVKDNKANKNTQDGFDLSGSGQKVTGSASNQTTNDYRISAPSAVSSPSSNKSDGTSIPSTSKCTGFFTNPAVLTCN